MKIRWPVRTKLLVAFATMIAFVASLGYLAYDRATTLGTIGDDQARMGEVSRWAEEMKVQLLQCRQAEKDFFLRDGTADHEQLHREYSEQFETAARNLVELSSNRDITERVDKVRGLMKRYRSLFAQTAAVWKARGHKDTGQIGVMRRAVHDFERTVAAANLPQLTIAQLYLRRHEKDFLLRRDDKYVDLLHDRVEATKKEIATIAMATETRLALRDSLAKYAQTFDEVVRSSREIARLRVEFDESAGAIVPASTEVVAVAIAHSDALRERAAAVRTTAASLIVGAVALLIVLSLLLSLLLARQISRNVNRLIEGTRRIGIGDLSQTISTESNDELGALGHSFNQMSAVLADMVGRVRATSETLEQLSTELSVTAAQHSSGMAHQASSVAETMTTVEELSRASQQVAERAQLVVSSANDSVISSKSGREALARSVESMNEIREHVEDIAATILGLSDKTQQVGAIVATVNNIAEQSNLLALNASIEAARAGEQGKAFSVVAAEVRNLAEQSQRATEQVGGILGEIQRSTNAAVMVIEEGGKRVERGIELIDSARSVIGELGDIISTSAQSAKQIAAATQQQAAGLQQISTAMNGINDLATQHASAIRQTETSTSDLATLSRQLSSYVEGYQVPS